VGISAKPNTRYRQHVTNPNSKMAPDVEHHQPSTAHFDMSIDSSYNTRAQAEKRERLLIEQLQSRGPGGHNCLRGAL
jgi:hypothetical protein